MKTVCEVLGVARSVVAVKQARSSDWQDGRSAKPIDDTELVEEIHAHVAHLPTYGYRRIWALLRRSREMVGAPCINHKRVIGSCVSTICCCVVPACDVTLAAVEQRFGTTQTAQPIEWPTDNGSAYIDHRTRSFARELGLEPLTTPVRSPQSKWHG